MPPKPPQSFLLPPAIATPAQAQQPIAVKKKKQSKWGKVSSNDPSFIQAVV